MQTMTLGKTGLTVTKPAFGALPIQRRSKEEAVPILRRAYEGGIRYFDTANSYTDSEEKLGLALADVRRNIVISTKSMGRDHDTVAKHIQMSLERLKTDYIDLFQFHMVSSWDEVDNGAYEAAVEAKEKGWVRHIGVTSHSIRFAQEAVASGRFETLQYPFSYLSSPEEFALVQSCREADMGFIAMKALAGGMLSNAGRCTRSCGSRRAWCPSTACRPWRSWSSGWPWRRRTRPWTRSCRPLSTKTRPSWAVSSAEAAATACPAPRG